MNKLSFFLFNFLLVLNLSAQDNLDYLLKADFLRTNKTYELAITYLDSIDNKDFYADFLTGEIYTAQQKNDKALEAYKLCNRKKPQFANFNIAKNYALEKHYDLALVYLKQHLQSAYKKPLSKINTESAFSSFKNTSEWKTLEIDTFYTQEEKLIEQAVFYSSNGDLNLALDILDELIAQNKNDAEAYFYRAKFIVFLNQDYKYAISDLKKAIKLDSKNYKYHRLLADLYFKELKYKKALKSYSLAKHIFPYSYQDILFITKAYYRMGEYKKSINYVNQYIRIDDRNIDALLLAGQINYDNKNYKASIAFLTRAISINSRRIDVLVARGKSYLEIDDYQRAGRDFNIALDLDTRNGELWYLKGLAFLYQDKRDDACKYFKKASYLNYYHADEYLLKECQ